MATFALLTLKLFIIVQFEVDYIFRVLKKYSDVILQDKRKKTLKYAQSSKGWLIFLTITSKRFFGFSQFLHYSTSGSKGKDDTVLLVLLRCSHDLGHSRFFTAKRYEPRRPFFYTSKYGTWKFLKKKQFFFSTGFPDIWLQTWLSRKLFWLPFQAQKLSFWA